MKYDRLIFVPAVLWAAALTGCQLLPSRDKDPFDDPRYQAADVDYRGIETPSFTDKVTKLVGRQPNRAKAKERFQLGEQAFNRAASIRKSGRSQDGEQEKALFGTATKEFVAAAKHLPNSELEQDAIFMAAEADFFRDYYYDANQNYERLLKKYPNTRHLDSVMKRRYAIALFWLGLAEKEGRSSLAFNFTDESEPWSNTFGEAVKILERMRLDDPTGDLADDATLIAAHAEFKAGNYLRADSLYSDLRDQFPSSPLQFEAHRWGLQAKIKRYRGVDYPTDVLVKSMELVKRMKKHFPRELREHREEIADLEKRLRFLSAEYDWSMAKYFDDRGEFGAARFYYRDIVREYGDTQFANVAAGRLREITDEPSHPPRRLAWLADLFPTAEDAKPLIPVSSGAKLR